MGYFTTSGPKVGPYRHRDDLGAAIGVIADPAKPWPIGLALPVRWDDRGRALWRLTVHGVELAGLWVVVDRRFEPARLDGGSTAT